MTGEQKNIIRKLRSTGLGYGAIAKQVSLPRQTVRSYCSRHNIPTATETKSSEDHSKEVRCGGTVFIVTTDYSESASETLVNKLEKLILDEAAR